MGKIEELENLFNDTKTSQELFFDKLERKLKIEFSSIKSIIRQYGSISFKLDKQYTIYIDRMFLFLKEDEECFVMRNVEELFIYLKIIKEYL